MQENHTYKKTMKPAKPANRVKPIPFSKGLISAAGFAAALLAVAVAALVADDTTPLTGLPITNGLLAAAPVAEDIDSLPVIVAELIDIELAELIDMVPVIDMEPVIGMLPVVDMLPIPVAVLETVEEQITVLRTVTPAVKQICCAYMMASAWSATEQAAARQQEIPSRKLSLEQMQPMSRDWQPPISLPDVNLLTQLFCMDF